MTQSVFEPVNHDPAQTNRYPMPYDDRGLYDKAFANRDNSGLLPVSAEFHTEWLPEAAQMIEDGEYSPDELTHDENLVLHEFMAERRRRIYLGEPVTDGEASEYINHLMDNPKNLPYEDSQWEIAVALAGKSGELLTPDEYFDVCMGNIRPHDRDTAWLNEYSWGEGIAPATPEYWINSPDYRLERVEGAFGPQLVSRRITPKSEFKRGGRVFQSTDEEPEQSLQEIAVDSPDLLELNPTQTNQHRLKAAGAALKAAGVTLKYGLLPNWMLDRKQSGSSEIDAETLAADQNSGNTGADGHDGLNALIEISEMQHRAKTAAANPEIAVTAAGNKPARARLLDRRPGEGRNDSVDASPDEMMALVEQVEAAGEGSDLLGIRFASERKTWIDLTARQQRIALALSAAAFAAIAAGGGYAAFFHK